MPKRQVTATQARLITAAVALAGIVAYPQVFPDRGRGHFDHYVFLDVIRRMHGGPGFYSAYRDAFVDVGVTLGQTRSFRLPTAFLLYRVVPVGWLFALFLVVVVAGTTLLLLWLTERPVVVLPVTLYLLTTGRIPTFSPGSSESWLLSELWCVPAIAGSLLAWKRERWWLAAGLAALAAITREHSALLLLGGLVAAHVDHRPRRPWLVAIGATGTVFVLHTVLASGYTQAGGTDATFLGTVDPPASLLHMMGWGIPTTDLVGLALWAGAVWALAHRRRDLLPAGGLLMVPLFGFVTNRPYWGIVMIPFTVFLASELVADTITSAIAARRSAAAGAESSPRPGTPAPGPGSPAGALAPPSS